MTDLAQVTPPALLHVGYPKTATTYLQNTVFCSAELGMGLAGGTENRSHLMQWIRTDDQYQFDPTAISAAMAKLEAPLRDAGLLPVWSEEVLLGNPIARVYDGAWNLQKLNALDRPFKILITARRQADLALSAYREYLKLHRHSLTDFIGTGMEPHSFQPILNPQYLKFDVAVAAYAQAFGRGNVLLLPQELLRADPGDFLHRLLVFAGLPPAPAPAVDRFNVGLGGTALVAARLLNGLFIRSPLSRRASVMEKATRRTLRFIDRVTPRAFDKRVEDRWRAQIDVRYARLFEGSNRRLQAFTDIDLAALGYPMSLA